MKLATLSCCPPELRSAGESHMYSKPPVRIPTLERRKKPRRSPGNDARQCDGSRAWHRCASGAAPAPPTDRGGYPFGAGSVQSIWALKVNSRPTAKPASPGQPRGHPALAAVPLRHQPPNRGSVGRRPGALTMTTGRPANLEVSPTNLNTELQLVSLYVVDMSPVTVPAHHPRLRLSGNRNPIPHRR